MPPTAAPPECSWNQACRRCGTSVAVVPAMRALVFLMCVSGCGAASVIPLIDHNGIPVTLTPAHSIPLEVITRKNSTVRGPLPVRGSLVAFEQIETALGHAVSSAAAPWVEAHLWGEPAGWQVEADLVAADARVHGREVVVSLDVRATLRARAGNRYLKQTQAHCQTAAVVAPRDASPVVFDCLAQVGRVLGGWLGGIEP